jgi:membrane protein DedA with SNARE-associated domain
MYDWFFGQQGPWLYSSLFFALLGGAFGLPIPEDLPLIIAGVLVHQGRADLLLILIVCYIAVVAGDVIIFRVGKKLGPALFTKRWFRRRVNLSTIKSMRLNLEKRSFTMILVARHLFYLRTVTFLICGAVKMNFTRFLIADMVAALISLPIMLGIGYLFSEHFDTMLEQISSIRRSFVIVSVPIIALICYLLYHRSKKKNLVENTTSQILESEDEKPLSIDDNS